jgi:hypothetical protein
MCREPQRSGFWSGINSDLAPPHGFIAASVNLPVMPSAQWDDKLVTDFASKCPVLCEPQVVGIRRSPSANQTRLLGHVSDVISVPNAAGLGEGEGAFVDLLRSRTLPAGYA